ncbi:HEPN domain-containing protein [Candidatus Margulisiibacteriota bacterium]
MVSKIKTRDVSKSYYSNYLKKAQECFNAAKTSFDSREWNASAINAIHACISACDAICVYFLGKRNAGESHNNAAVLFKTIGNEESVNINANRIVRILRIKNMAEYEERLMFKSEAEKVLKDCERFMQYVIQKLP